MHAPQRMQSERFAKPSCSPAHVAHCRPARCAVRRRGRAVEVRRVGRDGLPGRRACQQSHEDRQVGRAGISFSIPTQAMCSFGSETPRSALPSLVQTTTPPVSAIAKLTPVMPGVGCHELLAQVTCARLRPGTSDRSPRPAVPKCSWNSLADVFLLDVNGRQHDVAGRFVAQAARSARPGRYRPPRCHAVRDTGSDGTPR